MCYGDVDDESDANSWNWMFLVFPRFKVANWPMMSVCSETQPPLSNQSAASISHNLRVLGVQDNVSVGIQELGVGLLQGIE